MAAIAHRWGLNDSMISGAGAGLVSSVATCPLDVIKTKLQAQKSVRGSAGYMGVADTVKHILGRDGLRGLYRGLGPTMLGYLPTWAIYFTVYDSMKEYLSAEDDVDTKGKSRGRIYPAPHAKGYIHHQMQEHAWAVHILSAMIAGASSTIATNPLWVIKTRFMTQSADEIRYRHTLDAIRTIFRAEGLRAFYRGLLPSLLGIAHVAVQFPVYEQMKDWAKHSDGTPLSTTQILLCSGGSKLFASTATYPHEVVRTRLQIARHAADGTTARPGLISTVRDILTHEGGRGLYKGFSVNLLRTVPNSAVTMLTYELLMRSLGAHQDDHH